MKKAVRLPWLERGAAAGMLLGCVECVVTAASGRNLPVLYLVGIVAIDLAAGVAMGLVGLSLAWLLHRNRDESFPGVFVPLATAVGFVYLVDKSLVAAAFHDVPKVVGLGILVATSLAFAAIARRLARVRWLSGPSSEAALACGSLFVVIFLVGGRHLTRSVFVSYLRADALLVNGALAIATLVAVVVQYRLLAARAARISPAQLTLATVVTSSLIAGLAVWTSRAKPQTLPAREATSAVPDSRPNIILISIDTLRADRLSCYGYPRQTSPALDRLAAEGVLFQNAISPGNWTGPGHASMLTGTLPTTHGVRQYEHQILAASNLTLAEILANTGYQTGAIVSNASVLSKRHGFDQGFGFYEARMGGAVGYEPLLDGPLAWFPLLFGRVMKLNRTGADIDASALAWIERERGLPFFLFLNFMEPHVPYALPSPFDDAFPGRRVMQVSSPAWDLFRGTRDITPEEDAHYRALYDGEVAYVDHCIGQLLEELKALGVYDRSMVIVTSDHGEFFGEHRLWGHSVGPYQPIHHVPLIVKYPSGSRRGVNFDWVSLVDIAPTALEIAGVPVPSGVQGMNLTTAGHPVVIESAPNLGLTRQFGPRFSRTYKGLYEGSWKFVEYSDGSMELFDVQMDPEERSNLAPRRVEKVQQMKARLETYWAGLPVASTPEQETGRLDGLRALGYLE